DGDAILLADQDAVVLLEALLLQFLGEQAGHFLGGEHLQDLQLGADAVLGVDGPAQAFRDGDAVSSAHNVPRVSVSVAARWKPAATSFGQPPEGTGVPGAAGPDSPPVGRSGSSSWTSPWARRFRSSPPKRSQSLSHSWLRAYPSSKYPSARASCS